MTTDDNPFHLPKVQITPKKVFLDGIEIPGITALRYEESQKEGTLSYGQGGGKLTIEITTAEISIDVETNVQINRLQTCPHGYLVEGGAIFIPLGNRSAEAVLWSRECECCNRIASVGFRRYFELKNGVVSLKPDDNEKASE